MIRHYLKLSIRNLVKQWFHSIVNILGLGFGIACCIMIFIFVQHETSFNKFHENPDRIYRVISRFVEKSGEVGFTSFQPYSIVEGFREDIPLVERSTAFRYTWAWIKYREKNFREKIAFVDPDFLEIFSFPLIEVHSGGALENPQSVVITQEVADKILDNSIRNYADLIGQSYTFPQRPPNEFTISGILENIPDNSSMQFDVLVPIPNCVYYPRSNDEFGSNSVYIQLKDESALAQAEKTANTLIEKYCGQNLADLVHFGFLKEGEDNFKFWFQPLKDIYLNSDFLWGYEIRGSKRNIYILSIIAFIILSIACLNYIMLAIGQSMDRLKEMGIMKIMGAYKSQIIRYFISESFILVLLALFLGIVFAEQILPVFNNLAQKNLSFTLYKDWFSILFLVTILAIIVLTTSSYIALFLLRRSNPLAILKNEISIGKRYQFARTFVILQYFISIVSMITTGIIVRQLNYMLNKPVGFDKENVVVLAVDFSYSTVQVLKEKLRQYPLIKGVTSGDRNFSRSRSSNDIKNQKGELIETRILRIDPEYVDVLGLQIIEGSNFSERHVDDSIPSVLVNETFMRAFELDDPIGQNLFFDPIGRDFSIIGVVRDFHYDSMKDRIQPLMLVVFPYNSIWYIFVRIDDRDIPGALDQIKKAWDEVVPEYLIDYSFLDQNLEDRYMDQKRWSRITGYSAIAAIFLSCLGLLGLTGLLVAKRIKEITIRKVNGAKVKDILFLVNGEFQIWIFAAFILACPVSYLIMNKWMQNFAYRIGISWVTFALAGIVALLIALITVTWRSWRFARRNPVDTLRYE